ncbi:MAG: PDZ domain-containing protein [Chloroflexi bacterium]|nr:PDZ domain-containing protein [Chloroflexota bacterium]
MKHFRSLIIVGVLAVTILGIAAIASAQDATAVPETTTTETTTGSPSPFLGIVYEAAEGGVAVTDVVADSPAAAAGIAVGDVITALGGTAVTIDNLRDTVLTFAVGDTVSVALTRGEEQLTLDVTLAAVPAQFQFGRGNRDERGFGRPDAGILRLNRPTLGIGIDDSDAGVVVTQVVEGSPAEVAGIAVDDVITAINGTAVATARDAAVAVAEAGSAAEVGEFPVTVSVTRGEEALELTATLVKAELPALPEFPNMPGLGGRGERGGMGFGMGGFQIVPREGEEGAFNVVIPYTPADPAAVTQDVIDALASIGITIAPREGAEGVFDLTIPAESLGNGGILGDLQGMLPDGLEVFGFHGGNLNFAGPMGHSFQFSIPDQAVPATPETPEGSL